MLKNEIIMDYKEYEQALEKVKQMIAWLEKQGEQESAEWSEVDEKMFNSALWHVKNSCGNGGKNSGEYEVYNWVKSLKDRVTPQSKVEWSEEDEKKLDTISRILITDNAERILKIDGYTMVDIAKWLKALRPQKQWKPSEEQMDMINNIIYILNNLQYTDASKTLFDLYLNLKKL